MIECESRWNRRFCVFQIELPSFPDATSAPVGRGDKPTLLDLGLVGTRPVPSSSKWGFDSVPDTPNSSSEEPNLERLYKSWSTVDEWESQVKM